MNWKELTIQKAGKTFVQLVARKGTTEYGHSFRLDAGDTLEDGRACLRSKALLQDPQASF